MADHKANRRVPTGPDKASRLNPYQNPTPRGPRYKDRGRAKSVESGVSPLNRPKDCYPHTPRAKTKWYSPQYKDRYLAPKTGRGLSPLNRPEKCKDYDPRPSRAKTRWYSSQYKVKACDVTKGHTKNRHRRYSPGNRQQFNKVSPLNRPTKDTTQIQHPRPNSKPKVSCEGKKSSSPDLPVSRSQGGITRVLNLDGEAFLHYRSGSIDDEGYASASEGEDLPPQPQSPVHPARERSGRCRDSRVAEVYLVTSLARLSLFSDEVVPAGGEIRKVIYADLPRKRKREDLITPVCEKQRKIDAESVDDVCLHQGPKNADVSVVTSRSETDVIEAIDLCLQSMSKVKDTAPETTAQKDEDVNVSRRRRRRRGWRRKADKSSNTAESRRHIGRVGEDPLDLSC